MSDSEGQKFYFNNHYYNNFFKHKMKEIVYNCTSNTDKKWVWRYHLPAWKLNKLQLNIELLKEE